MYNFKISYIKGTKNAKVDVLNRKLKYFENKIYLFYTIFKIKGDTLVFNRIELNAII